MGERIALANIPSPSGFGYNLFIIIILFILVVIYILYLTKKHKDLNRTILFLSLLFHTLTTSSWIYMLKRGAVADAVGYYLRPYHSDNIMNLYGIGGRFIDFMVYPFIKILKFNIVSTFILFNIIGFIGLSLLYLALQENIGEEKKAKKLIYIILFLPGLNYWTSFIGKDSVMLIALSMVLLSINNMVKRKKLMAIGLGLTLLMRPHILICICCALFITVTLYSKINILLKAFISLLIILLLAVGIRLFKEHAKIESLDVESAQEYIESREQWGGGSTVDISNYNIVFKVLTFLYRPLFFDAKNFNMILASFENLLYLIITIRMFMPKFLKFIFNSKSIFIKFNFFYFGMATIMLAMVTPNLGTAVRHKNMVTISILSLMVLFAAEQYRIKRESLQKINLERQKIPLQAGYSYK